MDTNWNKRFHLNTRKHFCTAQVTALVQLAQRGCGVSSLKIFKSHLGMVLSNLIYATLLEQMGLTRQPPEVPSILNHSVIHHSPQAQGIRNKYLASWPNRGNSGCHPTDR